MLAYCEETNLVLSWEKCYIMVNEGIVLGHKISREDDKCLNVCILNVYIYDYLCAFRCFDVLFMGSLVSFVL